MKEIKQEGLAVQTINLSQARRSIVLCFHSGVTVVVWGPTGVGKTTLIKDLTHDLAAGANLEVNNEKALKGTAFGFWKISPSVLEPADVCGIPYPDKEQWVRFLMNKMIPYSKNARGVLFIDELDRCSREMQNAVLRLLDREVNDAVIGPKVHIVLAGNGSSDMYTTPLSEAYRSRVCHLYVTKKGEGGVKSYTDWAKKNGVSEMMQGFAAFRPDVWGANDSVEFEDLGVPNPRAFDNADKVIRAADALRASSGFETSDILFPTVAGLIGQPAAVELLAYRRMFEKLPKMDSILTDPKGAALPRNEDKSLDKTTSIALIHALVPAVKGDLKKLNAVALYVMRLDTEVTATAFRLLEREYPQLNTIPTVLGWINEHKYLFSK